MVGIARLPEPQLDRSLALITLADAQDFFAYGDRVSELAVLADDADAAEPLQRALIERFAQHGVEAVEVRSWSQLMPELVQLLLLDDAGMVVMLALLLVVVAFGIFNTILMAVLERKREFGVLLALGLSPRAVFRIVYLESLMLAAVGLVIGLALGLALVLWFQAHPVTLTSPEFVAMTELFGIAPQMVWKLKPLNPLGSTLAILVVALLAALYPALKASRGRPVDVLRSL